MARRPKGAAEAAPETVSLRDPLDAAMAMIGLNGWRKFTLVDLAAELGLSIAEIYERFPCRAAILSELGKRLDNRMLDVAAADLTEMNTRDRLFELMMRRLDAMKPYKPALRRMARESRGDPEAGLAALGNLTRAIVEIVEAAGISGPMTYLARNGVGMLYARVFRVWLDDDEPEQGKTLAELDKGLAKMEGAAQKLARFMPKRRSAEPQPEAA